MSLGDGQVFALQPFTTPATVLQPRLTVQETYSFNFTYPEAGTYTLSVSGYADYSFDEMQRIGEDWGPVERHTSVFPLFSTSTIVV